MMKAVTLAQLDNQKLYDSFEDQSDFSDDPEFSQSSINPGDVSDKEEETKDGETKRELISHLDTLDVLTTQKK